MDAVLRGVAIYLILFLLMRLSGKRTFAEVTAFDFVLILIIAETTQQALLGDDFSITNAVLLITTLLGIDILLSILKQKWSIIGDWIDGKPVLLIENGELKKERMNRARIAEADILESGRKLHGLTRLEQVKFAILEQSGSISIVPK